MPNLKQSILTRIPNSVRGRTLRYLHVAQKITLAHVCTSGDDDDDDFWNDSSTYGEEW